MDELTLEEELNRSGRQFAEIEGEIRSIESKMADPDFYNGNWESSIERYQELQSMLTQWWNRCCRTCTKCFEASRIRK